jgi:hypothetical protein
MQGRLASAEHGSEGPRQSHGSKRAENMTVIIPVLAAQKRVNAKTDEQRQAAVLETNIYLNAEATSQYTLIALRSP